MLPHTANVPTYCIHSLVADLLFPCEVMLRITALCGDTLTMIFAGWPPAEWELSVTGNLRWRGKLNVRDNIVADRQAVWSLWLLASLIETDALLSWGPTWQMEAKNHRRLCGILSDHRFWCLRFSRCQCDNVRAGISMAWDDRVMT